MAYIRVIRYGLDNRPADCYAIRARENNMGDKDMVTTGGGKLNRSGRPRGARNKLTGAHGDLLAAWDKVSGPITAQKLMKAAIETALGLEVKTPDGKIAGKLPPDWEPLRTILPYIARKMPESLEVRDLPSMPLEDALKIISEFKALKDDDF